MTMAQAGQPLAVQHIDAALRIGDDIVLVAAAFEQRHLTEEIAFPQLDEVSRRHAHRGLAAADEIHRPAGIASGHDRGAGLEEPRVEQLGDFGDLGRVKRREQRHARHHAPGDDEFVTRRFLAEAGGEDGDGKREHAEPEQHDDAAEHLAPGRDRHDVAIADGGQRRQGPPGGSGNGAEFVGLRLALEEIDDGGREQHQHHHEEERTEQRAIFVGDDALQRQERRRIAQQFEQPEQTEQAQDPQGAQVERHEQVDIKGQDGEKVDDHHRPKREVQPRAPMRHAAIQRNLDRAPQPEHIFDGEDDHREDVERLELRAPALIDRTHRLGGEGEAVGDDENDEEDIDDAADGIAVADLQNVVNLGPPATPDGLKAHGQAIPARRAPEPATASAPPVISAAIASSAASARAPSGPPALRKIGTAAAAFAAKRLGAGAGKLDRIVGAGEIVGDADDEAGLAFLRHADNGDDAGAKLALGVIDEPAQIFRRDALKGAGEELHGTKVADRRRGVACSAAAKRKLALRVGQLLLELPPLIEDGGKPLDHLVRGRPSGVPPPRARGHLAWRDRSARPRP